MHCLWKESTEELQRKKELVPAFEFSKPSPQEGADRIQCLDKTEENYTKQQLRASHAGGARGEARMERDSGPPRKGNTVPSPPPLEDPCTTLPTTPWDLRTSGVLAPISR